MDGLDFILTFTYHTLKRKEKKTYSSPWPPWLSFLLVCIRYSTAEVLVLIGGGYTGELRC